MYVSHEHVSARTSRRARHSWLHAILGCTSDVIVVVYVGHECPQGSWEPIRCESGYYQDETTQGMCELCPAGFYCDDTYEPVVLFNSSYCPKGTSLEVPGDVCGIFRCLWEGQHNRSYCFDTGVIFFILIVESYQMNVYSNHKISKQHVHLTLRNV